MMNAPLRGALVGCVLFALTASLSAQTSIPFPLVRAATDNVDAVTGLPVLVPDANLVRDLMARDTVVLRGFVMPSGAAVDLDLRKIDLNRMKFGFQVDGRPAPGLLSGLNLSVWTGTIAGESDSEVVISFSNRGSAGWIRGQGDLVHLLPRRDAAGSLVAREAELNERGMALGKFCDLDAIPDDGRAGFGLPAIPVPDVSHGAGGSDGTGDCSVWECEIAIETDFQYYSLFNDLGAATTYLTTLLAAVSDRYEEQIDTILTYPYVQFYTTSNDPWSTPDTPGGSDVMLGEFVTAWTGNIPGGARLGHFVSGAGLGGGIAYVGVLCDSGQEASFAVSGNIGGDTPFPVAVSPLNWDFMVFAHETGHNFNSPHTHNYSPQIDDCNGGACITDGTIMSYCHQCPGGLENITTYFHPTVVSVMQSHANTCLPLLAPLVADITAQPTLIPANVATPLSVELQGIPVGDVSLNYRMSPLDSFSAVTMVDQGGGLYTGDIPSPACDDTPEWNFSMVDTSCGPFSTPTFGAEVGTQTIQLTDDFEAASGWTVGSVADDATTGVWERGDPIGTGAQPENDVTSGGTDCFFTGQGSPGGGLGENDIDDGQTTLTSPVIDLSAGDARISYWRWFSNDSGSTPNTEVFTVDVNSGSGWVNVETLGPTGEGTSGGWFYHQFTVSDFVTPTSSVQVRFIAADLDEGSLVEAAIDEFAVFNVDCGTLCQEDVGFGGPGSASLSLCGGDLSTGTTANLTLVDATPNSTAFLIAGLVFNPTPAEGGMLVPVPFVVNLVLLTDANGGIDIVVPGGQGPVTFYVQYGFIDPSQVVGFGLSNALEVDLLP